MTDALHTCARCGVADETVRRWPVTEDGKHEHPTHRLLIECVTALKRELAAANALLERCVPYVLASTKKDGQTGENARAILADINGRRA